MNNNRIIQYTLLLFLIQCFSFAQSSRELIVEEMLGDYNQGFVLGPPPAEELIVEEMLGYYSSTIYFWFYKIKITQTKFALQLYAYNPEESSDKGEVKRWRIDNIYADNPDNPAKIDGYTLGEDIWEKDGESTWFWVEVSRTAKEVHVVGMGKYDNSATIDLKRFDAYIPASLSYSVKPATGYAYAIRTANIREGPGTGFPIRGQLQAGDQIYFFEETQKWYHFKTKRFADGWVSKSLTSRIRPDIVVDKSKPEIVLSSPELVQNIYRTVEAIVTVRGRAADPEGIAFVTIAGKNVQLRSDGSFAGRVRLKLGKNTIPIRTIDLNDNVSDMEFFVFREEFFEETEFSDVDFPPKTTKKNKNGIAVVYGIESYQYAPSVSYAYNDADIFREYLVSTFGLSRENIYFRTNERATKGEFDKAFSKDGWISKRSTKNSDVFIFFAGHGAPEIQAKTTYLIPYDIDPNYTSTGYALEELFLNLGQISARSVTIVVDACFSGGTRDGSPLLADSRPVYIETISAAIPKNVVVFSAASGNEVSSAYKSKKHGLFTYFFLKGLNGEADSNKDKKITILEMYDYLEDTIPSQASKMDREQHPTLMGSETHRVLLKY